jgi:hypothetical protein
MWSYKVTIIIAFRHVSLSVSYIENEVELQTTVRILLPAFIAVLFFTWTEMIVSAYGLELPSPGC